MKRSIEAHTTTILALCCIYVRKRICDRKNKDEIIEFLKDMKQNSSLEDDAIFQSFINSSTTKFNALEINKLFER